MRYPHLAARVFNTPLAIHRGKAEAIVAAVVMPKLRGESFEEIEAGDAPALSRRGAVAVLPVRGTLVRRASGMEAMSGLQSYDAIREMLRSAVADRGVGAILLDVDSHGGELSGLPDLADEIAAARAAKPVYAAVNDHGYSAAYWLASAAERVFATRTAGVGSIGVIAMHVDQSVFDQKTGFAYTPIFSGDHKNDFSPHEPLSEPARAAIKADVDRARGMFADAVAARRPLTVEAVLATQAACLNPEAARDLRLIDEIGTLDDAAADLARRLATARPGAARGRAAMAPRNSSMDRDAPEGAPAEAGAAVDDRPAATGAPPRTAEVVDLDRVRAEARGQGEAAQAAAFMARAAEVNDLCALARMPHLAGEMIARTGADGRPMPVAEVRRELQRRQAAEADATHVGGLNPGAGGARASAPQARVDPAAIYGARAKAMGQAS